MIFISGFSKNKDQVQRSLFEESGHNRCSKAGLIVGENINHKSTEFLADGQAKNG